MNKKRTTPLLLAGFAAMFVLDGCSMGVAEKGDDNAVKSDYQKMTVDQKIDWWNHSPLPQNEKDKKIADIKAGKDTGP